MDSPTDGWENVKEGPMPEAQTALGLEERVTLGETPFSSTKWGPQGALRAPSGQPVHLELPVPNPVKTDRLPPDPGRGEGGSAFGSGAPCPAPTLPPGAAAAKPPSAPHSRPAGGVRSSCYFSKSPPPPPAKPEQGLPGFSNPGNSSKVCSEETSQEML